MNDNVRNTCLFIQQVKKNRDPRWDEEFTFMLEEPPVKDRMHVEVLSTSSRIGLLHPKVISCEPLLADMQLFLIRILLKGLWYERDPEVRRYPSFLLRVKPIPRLCARARTSVLLKDNEYLRELIKVSRTRKLVFSALMHFNQVWSVIPWKWVIERVCFICGAPWGHILQNDPVGVGGLLTQPPSHMDTVGATYHNGLRDGALLQC